ncbi:sensor histidine kinase [Gimesia maris]|uniref:sensor histidine kinase n=1 Tax=Gimesia maris TaxID=122 RepID=UPI000E92690B|nr:MFS domain-containing histidine kinase [Gimesia maris]HAW27514.1 histidine kinase [Planctomycetaceae bacterium]|tara:strand:- start:4187 stop:5191 length:1005 start_codon:yes stop_codon:yes gene_type:complete
MSSTRHQQLDEDEQSPPTVAEVPARTGNRSALQLMRKVRRGRLRLPITLSVVLMVLNVALMVFWIILAAQIYWWTALTIGTVVFVLILVGLSLYLVLTIKEVRLSQRQSDFIDSVTHELKTPIATLRLYLETLQMRSLAEEQRSEFYSTMKTELERLDHLISQLLEVKRLDALGMESDPEDILLEPLIRHCARVECNRRQFEVEQIFEFDIEPAVIHTRRILLEMIFRNVIDNAIKYGASEPQILVQVRVSKGGRVITRVMDNGEGVDPEIRKDIFKIFYRGESELERRKTGTGLGLYIVRTLVHLLGGKVTVHDRLDQPGSVFAIDLPGRAET